jgi:hypothetical protein
MCVSEWLMSPRYATIRYLFPQWDRDGPREGVGPHHEAVYYLRQTPLLQLLALRGEVLAKVAPLLGQGLEWVPNAWYEAATQRQYRTGNWMLAQVEYTYDMCVGRTIQMKHACARTRTHTHDVSGT